MSVVSIPTPRRREFLPKDYRLTVWSRIKPYFNELLSRTIESIEHLNQWMLDRNEIESLIDEEINWRYLRFAQDSSDLASKEAYNYAVQEIESKLGPIRYLLDQKLLASPYAQQLPIETFGIYLQKIKNERTLFCKENQSLKAEVEVTSRKYTEIYSSMSITVRGQQLTVQEAHSLLEDRNREIREEVFSKLSQAVLAKKETLNTLFSKLLTARHQIALNAGFENFRDYQFQALHRTDYNVKECNAFQEGILQHIVPLIKRFNAYRKEALNLKSLRPWDTQVDIQNRSSIKPFGTAEELINRTTKTLEAISPYFGECFSLLEEKQHLDLFSRKQKRPGGFMMSMPQSGTPFIFCNATRSIKDVRILLHESGHAIHAFLMKDLHLSKLRRVPSEVSELAAMTMELLGMEQWESFFPKKDQLIQAKTWQLFRVLEILPWIAAIDRFQHWIYTHPTHSLADREEKWDQIYLDFCLPDVDWTGHEEYRRVFWFNQLHMFESPFYYVEYGFAQLGAIALWLRYQEKPEAMLSQFISAMKLGGTQTVTETYRVAGIPFDWSPAYLEELSGRITEELQKVLGEEL